MKRIVFLLIGCLSLISITNAQNKNIDWFKGSYDEAIKEAAKTNKNIFIDFYAEWCGPCKSMLATTLKDNELVKFFNEHFICLKVDADKDKPLCSRYNVSALPTVLILDNKENQLYSKKGFHSKERLLTAAKMLLKGDFKDVHISRWEKGERSIELALATLKAMNARSMTSDAYMLGVNYVAKLTDEEKLTKTGFELLCKLSESKYIDHSQYIAKHRDKYFKMVGIKVDQYLLSSIYSPMNDLQFEACKYSDNILKMSEEQNSDSYVKVIYRLLKTNELFYEKRYNDWLESVTILCDDYNHLPYIAHYCTKAINKLDFLKRHKYSTKQYKALIKILDMSLEFQGGMNTYTLKMACYKKMGNENMYNKLYQDVKNGSGNLETLDTILEQIL